MRILVLISTDHYVRNFLTTGAFDRLEGEVLYVGSEGGVTHPETRARLEALPGWQGTVPDPRAEARVPYRFLRQLLLAQQRFRSRTMRNKVALLPWRRRLRLKLAALPGVRTVLRRRALARTGLNPELHDLMSRLRPDLVLAPSGGYDTLVWDGMRSASELGIPMLLLVHNWDNLSSKGAFVTEPDYLAVWGEQSVEHAERIHGIPRERVRAVGAPAFEGYFRHVPGSSERPFPFRYVLFAGCFAPFDERAALERLDRLIEREALDLKVVYRPHPHRRPRAVPDRVDESELRHVVLDPDLRPIYEASFEEGQSRAKPLLPPLDTYPGRFEHADFVICPLSTMIVEAALFERRVIVVAYDDGVHRNSPAVVVGYDHFEGIDRVEGFELARTADDLESLFARFAAEPTTPPRPMRDQVRWWLEHDERSYAERLAGWVAEIARREGLPGPPARPDELVPTAEAR